MEFDGYSDFKTKTPIQGGSRKSKGDTKRIGNRIIGGIVTCGPIDTRFIYSLNDLISGGANTMIEVIRQGKCIVCTSTTIYSLQCTIVSTL